MRLILTQNGVMNVATLAIDRTMKWIEKQGAVLLSEGEESGQAVTMSLHIRETIAAECVVAITKALQDHQDQAESKIQKKALLYGPDGNTPISVN